VHAWLSEQSYWAQGRPRAVQDAAIDASLNYGVHDEQTGEQVACARVVTDGATFGWLCDVFVCSDARGQGVGKMLVEGVAADLDRLGLNRTLLTTGDAQGLYAQFGFSPLEIPSQWMVRTVTP
jgi:GNAT superfamily N-acetyltransferase